MDALRRIWVAVAIALTLTSVAGAQTLNSLPHATAMNPADEVYFLQGGIGKQAPLSLLPSNLPLMRTDASNAILPDARNNLGLGPFKSANQFGAACDGTTDDTDAFLKIASTATGAVLIPGTCVIQARVYAFVHPVSLIGYGNGSSVIKLKSGSILAGDLLFYSGVNGYVIQGLTIDANNSAVTASHFVLATLIHNKNAANFVITGNRFINYPPPDPSNTTTGMVALLDESVTDWEESYNYIAMTGSSPNTQGAISIIANPNPANHRGKIVSNTIVHGIIESKCLDCTIANNDISAWGFGSGITVDIDTVSYSARTILINNRIHDSVLVPDVNMTYIGGTELNGPDNVYSGNMVYNNCGDGVSINGHHNVVANNIVFDNGKCGQAGQQDGIHANYGDATDNGNNSLVVGNVTFDSGGGTQKYGYGEQSSSVANITLSGNRNHGNATAPLNILGSSTVYDPLSNDQSSSTFPGVVVADGIHASDGSATGQTIGSFLQPSLTTASPMTIALGSALSANAAGQLNYTANATPNQSTLSLGIWGEDGDIAVVRGDNNFLLPHLPASAGGGGLYVCVDTDGVLYKKSACP